MISKSSSLTSSFNEAQKSTLRHFLILMLEADEPEALLSSLRRISERKAHAVMKGFLNGQIEGDEAQRWFNLAEALIKVEQELKDKKNG